MGFVLLLFFYVGLLLIKSTFSKSPQPSLFCLTQCAQGEIKNTPLKLHILGGWTSPSVGVCGRSFKNISESFFNYTRS